MPTRIRLQRKGKKGQPFYHLVVADGRAPRDGKFIERLGTYNPMTHPATIEINFERALHWIQVGAQPSDTARSLLSHKGVMLKHHLLKGVLKGALTEEQVEEKFQTWLNEKSEKVSRIAKEKELEEKESTKGQLELEKKINEARAESLSKKRAAEVKAAKTEQPVDAAGEEPSNSEAAPETTDETVTDTPPVAETNEDITAKQNETPEEATESEEK